MQRPHRPQLPAPPNQLTAQNIKVSSFVTIGKTTKMVTHSKIVDPLYILHENMQF
jgi:hypothetical protein